MDYIQQQQAAMKAKLDHMTPAEYFDHAKAILATAEVMGSHYNGATQQEVYTAAHVYATLALYREEGPTNGQTQ